MQEIARELGLSDCWICGGLKSEEKRPWKGEGLAPEQLLKWKKDQTLGTIQRPEGWILDQRIIGSVCVSREGKEYRDLVCYTLSISTLYVNSDNKSKIWQPEVPMGYWSQEQGQNCNWNKQLSLCWYKSSGANPYQSIKELKTFWEEPENVKITWKAPNGPYWICGRKAYSELQIKEEEVALQPQIVLHEYENVRNE